MPHVPIPMVPSRVHVILVIAEMEWIVQVSEYTQMPYVPILMVPSHVHVIRVIAEMVWIVQVSEDNRLL